MDEYRSWESRFQETNINKVIIPVLLVDAALYTASLDKGKVKIKKITCGYLNYQPPWNIGTEHLHHFPVVTVGYFKTFLRNVEAFGKDYTAFLEKHPQFQLIAMPKRDEDDVR
jgi:hypothetical protein